jgi:ERCC4-type nuclease
MIISQTGIGYDEAENLLKEHGSVRKVVEWIEKR